METAQNLIERRLDRMRLGQAVCEVVELPSDPEIRIALVPLTEAEYDRCLAKTVALQIDDTFIGNQYRDRELNKAMLQISIREPDNLTVTVFDSVKTLEDALEVTDINFIMDRYFEMVEKSSPELDAMTDEQIDGLKKVLQTIDLKELTGRQWYAAKRFLLSLGPQLLEGSLPGFSSTSKLTGMNDSEEPTSGIAEESSPNLDAKFAENR